MCHRAVAGFAHLLLLAAVVGAPAPGSVAADAAVADGVAEPAGPTVPTVLERVDSDLQAGLQEIVAELDLGSLVRRSRLGVALVDVAGSRPRYASLNGDRMFYAASLPKIAVLLCTFDAIERGALEATPAVLRWATRMIRFSDNEASNRLLEIVGFRRVAELLRSERYRLYDPRLGGGLWIGKAYGRDRYWRRDPLAGLSHGATPRQVARFFVMLDRGALVSKRSSTRMKRILGDPGIGHKFVRGLSGRPGTRIYRKSGTWRDYHADAALVEHGDARYVLVGLLRDARGGEILQRLASAVDDHLTADSGPRKRAR